MLFNLSCCRHFPNKQTGKEIYCGSAEGPDYGYAELHAYSEPFNGDGNCTSYANGYYGITIENGKNTLTNKEGG